ncbi:hypothetical protein EZJ49_13850 [Bdellovibrio bacteriovorus]|uniref:hypothetical protein n=1 Tax=Bdellovibrio bacteriovorus TaxID=959 RepID=UPI0021D1D9E1|nr:hypothetical protein [Bdellovibrio bacteriovorus]UXR64145.1 hypothetical protein EZJ49_13850 [Bdellovibrio bacteriovorus]
MGDDSSRSIVKSLKNEWSLFLEAFQGEDHESEKKSQDSQDAFAHGQLEVLDLDQIREMTKALVEDRKKLNQKLESLSKEIDLNSAKLESLRLVGGQEDETMNRISELHDLGQSMAQALQKLDKKLRSIREQEDRLNEELLTS